MQRKTEEGATILVCTRLDFTLERIMASVDARRQVCNIYEKASCFFLLFCTLLLLFQIGKFLAY